MVAYLKYGNNKTDDPHDEGVGLINVLQFIETALELWRKGGRGGEERGGEGRGGEEREG